MNLSEFTIYNYMMDIYAILLFLLLLYTSTILVCAHLSRRFLFCQLLICYFFDSDSYYHYQSVIRYNKVTNRSIPVYEGYEYFDPDDPRFGGYYIMDRGLYYRGKCLGMRHLELMMNDLIKRNSLEMN